jgi:hypothetical protein
MKTTVNEKIVTQTLRERLKVIMQAEIEKLPEALESLEPRERLNVLCRLMPYVFPKVESISSSSGEPFTMETW